MKLKTNWITGFLNNKKGQLEFDDISIVGIIGGLLGGMFSIFITKQMGGGLFLKLAGFVITGIVCYVVASKISDE